MITMIFILTLIFFGAISLPLFVYEAIKYFAKLVRRGGEYTIEVNKYKDEFEELLSNITHTHANYYGSRIKIKKR